MIPGQIDPKMDMTKDMDLIKGSMGVSYWFTSIKDIPSEFFKKHVEGKSFMDLGCGDGRVISLARRCGAKKYRGIEIDDQFIKNSMMSRFIKKGDLQDVDLEGYEVLYYFLGSDEGSEAVLVDNLKKFKGTLILYHRKVPHRLQEFNDVLLEEGFKEIDNIEYLRVYEK